MSRDLQPPVPISLVKIELPIVIKNDPSESEIVEIGIDDILNSLESEEEIISDLVCEDPIKSEILESYHCESVETQDLVEAENAPFIKTENISQRNKTEGTSNENVTKSTGQAVVQVQAATLWEKKKEKIKVIEAPVIPVEAHEYTSLANGRQVCNHCQCTFSRLHNLRKHIEKIHREVTTMYQCPYCPYKSKWKACINQHIIPKHKDTKDIQWFQCNLCEMKFKLKKYLTVHVNVHLPKQMQDGLNLREKRYHCDTCDHKTYTSTLLKKHNLVHLKPEEIEYFYCYKCSYKSKQKYNLMTHIFRHHFINVRRGKRHDCEKCDYKTYRLDHLKSHKLIHLKPDEIQYFYCYHCSYKSKHKMDLKNHIFGQHFKNVKQEKTVSK